jgi:prepilin-type N-terminal cleavage/methylation domain-containing protein
VDATFQGLLKQQKKMRSIMHKRKGFTLIELLVVISIITLLMAILMATLQRVRKQAKAVACQSNLRQWNLVFSMYDNDYEGRFCSGCSYIKTNDQRHWAMALRPYYYHDRQITLCPLAIKPYDEGGEEPYGAWRLGREPGFVLFSYGLNGWVYNAKDPNSALISSTSGENSTSRAREIYRYSLTVLCPRVVLLILVDPGR